MTRVVFVGAGNVASSLAPAIEKSGAGEIVQVYSRDIANARALARCLRSAEATDSLDDLKEADIYIISVADDAVAEIARKVGVGREALWLHTSGSVPMTALSPLSGRYGVYYPLQTFSKQRPVDMDNVSLFVEGATPEVEEEIREFALKTFSHVYHADSETRRKMHVAAVFACNFSNFMWVIADDLLRGSGIPFSVLDPLLRETLDKALSMSPADGQTGPARRFDSKVMSAHENSLSESDREIYHLLSERIMNYFKS